VIKNAINKSKSKLKSFHFFHHFLFSLYRKYGVIGQKKPEVKYVVSKKSQRGGRPAGTKGPYKVVDKRLKKDKRAAKNRSKKQQSNNKGRKQQKSVNRKKRT
jgi:hypothetical protein